MASRPVVALRALRITPQAQPFVFRISRRCLSQTSRQDSMVNNAARGAAAQASRSMPARQQRSWRLRMKEREVPRDVGLLPGLYAPPRWPAVRSSISSVVKDRKLLWTVLYERLRQWWSSATMMYAWKFTLLPEHAGTWKFWRWMKEAGRPTFGWRKTKQEAKDLHQRLYTALAAGCPDVGRHLSSQRARSLQDSRQPAKREVMEWDANYHRVHLESLLVAAIPQEMVENSAIMQAVFRIKSTQKLTRPKNQDGNNIKQQQMVEHLVLQKNFWEGEQEKNWKIWGLIDEMSVKSLLEMSGEQQKVQASQFDRASWLQRKLGNTRLGKRLS